jgi:lipopolysaccharide/colanic/teichoic acid biosynthesis glycosyltransferase
MGGAKITSGGDTRITRIGAVLRKYKLDELPQLWNIMAGQMCFVGPRPEVASFVEPSRAIWKELLKAKPGLTDPSSLIYRNEEELLSQYEDAETAYRTEILPRKLELSARYLRGRCMVSDCRLLLWTVRYSFFPVGFDANRLVERFIEG